MKAYLFIRDGFMYIVDGTSYHSYYHKVLSKDVSLTYIHSYMHRGNMYLNQTMESDSIEECIKTFEVETFKLTSRDFLEIILSDSYSKDLRFNTLDLLSDMLKQFIPDGCVDDVN
jgi:hypothetical protein